MMTMIIRVYCRLLVAKRLTIKKLSKQLYNKTIQYETRNEMKCNAMRRKELRSTEETDMGKVRPIGISGGRDG